MTNFILKGIRSIGDSIKGVDWFGKTINITYKKEDSYKTFFGGFMTIGVSIALILYLVYLIRVMIERQSVVYSTNTVIRDLTNDFDDHKPAEHGFAIAIGFRWDDTSFLDEEYLQLYDLSVYQYRSNSLGGGAFNETYVPLEIEKWGDTFPYEDQQLIKDYRIDNYVCIKPKDYAITGNWYSDIVKSLNIVLSSCDWSKRSDCKPYTDTDAHITNRYFDVVIIDSYFDLKSFEKPIKSYLTQKYFYTFEAGYYESIELFVKENSIEALDDYKIVEGSKDGKFYSIADDRQQRAVATGYSYWGITFYLHPETQAYNRQVFTFMDVLAQLGGVFGLIQPLWAFIVGFYAEKMLYYSIFSQLYTFDTQKDEEDDMKNKREDIYREPEINSARNVNSKQMEGSNDKESIEFAGGSNENLFSKHFAKRIGKFSVKIFTRQKPKSTLILIT